MVTREGKRLLMSIAFGSVAPISTYYLGIISYLGGLGERTDVQDWTLLNLTPLFSEFTDVSNPTRIVWTPQSIVDGRVLGVTLQPYLTLNGCEPWGIFLTNQPAFNVFNSGVILSVHQMLVPVHHDAGTPLSSTLWVSLH